MTAIPRKDGAGSRPVGADGPGRSLAWVAGLSLFALALYGFTWSNQYFHDGAFLVERFRRGEVLHMHAAFLLLAAAIGRLFGMHGDPEALRIAALLVGAATPAALWPLLRAIGCGARSAAASVLFLLFAPAVWFGGSILEMHLAAGLLACLGAWVCLRARLPFALSYAAGLTIALFGHLSALTLAPCLAITALVGAGRRGRAVPARRALVGGTLVTVLIAFLARALARHSLGGGGVGFGNLAGAVLEPLAGIANPLWLFGRLWEEIAIAWLFTLPLALVGVVAVMRSRRSEALVIAMLFGLAPVAVGVVAAPLRGQYLMVALPAFAIGVGWFFETVGRRAKALTGAVVVLQLALGATITTSMKVDPDRDWAEALPALPEPHLVICNGRERSLLVRDVGNRAMRYTGRPGLEPMAVARDVAVHAAERVDAGEAIFFDPAIFEPTGLAEFDAARRWLRETLELAPYAEGALLAPRGTDGHGTDAGDPAGSTGD